MAQARADVLDQPRAYRTPGEPEPPTREPMNPAMKTALFALLVVLAGLTCMTVGASIWLGIGPALAILGTALVIIGVLIGL